MLLCIARENLFCVVSSSACYMVECLDRKQEEEQELWCSGKRMLVTLTLQILKVSIRGNANILQEKCGIEN